MWHRLFGPREEVEGSAATEEEAVATGLEDALTVAGGADQSCQEAPSAAGQLGANSTLNRAINREYSPSGVPATGQEEKVAEGSGAQLMPGPGQEAPGAEAVSHAPSTLTEQGKDDLNAEDPVYLPYQPPLELTESEMFRDEDGNTHDIPFFGQRTPDGCFVDTKAVGAMLGLDDHFRKTLTSTTSKFVPGLHFAYIPHDESITLFHPL